MRLRHIRKRLQHACVLALEKVIDQRVPGGVGHLGHHQAPQRLHLLSGEPRRQTRPCALPALVLVALPLFTLHIRAHRNQHGLADVHNRHRSIRHCVEQEPGENL